MKIAVEDYAGLNLPDGHNIVVAQPNHFLTANSDLQGKEVRIVFEVETGKVHSMAEIKHFKVSSIQINIPMTEQNTRVAENVVGRIGKGE